MFHVLLAAPVLALMAAYGAIVLVVLSIPFCIGTFLQLVLTIFGQKNWILWVPAGLGLLGLAVSMLVFLSEVQILYILLYWMFYFLSLWIVWLVVEQIKNLLPAAVVRSKPSCICILVSL